MLASFILMYIITILTLKYRDMFIQIHSEHIGRYRTSYLALGGFERGVPNEFKSLERYEDLCFSSI